MAPLLEMWANSAVNMVAGDGVNTMVDGIIRTMSKGVGVLLDLFQDIRIGVAGIRTEVAGMIVDVRSSLIGSKMFGDVTTADRKRRGDAQLAESRLRGQPRPSLALSQYTNDYLAKFNRPTPTAPQAQDSRLNTFLKAKLGPLAAMFSDTAVQLSKFDNVLGDANKQILLSYAKSLVFGTEQMRLTPALAEAVMPMHDRHGPLAALEAGTAEAFAASRKNMPGNSKSALEQLNAQQLGVMKEMKAELEQIPKKGPPERGLDF